MKITIITNRRIILIISQNYSFHVFEGLRLKYKSAQPWQLCSLKCFIGTRQLNVALVMSCNNTDSVLHTLDVNTMLMIHYYWKVLVRQEFEYIETEFLGIMMNNLHIHNGISDGVYFFLRFRLYIWHCDTGAVDTYVY